MKRRKKYLVSKDTKFCAAVYNESGTIHIVNGLPLFETDTGKLLRPSISVEGLVDGARYKCLYRSFDGEFITKLGPDDKLFEDVQSNELDLGNRESVLAEYCDVRASFVIDMIIGVIGCIIAAVVLHFLLKHFDISATYYYVGCALTAIYNIFILIKGFKCNILYDRTGSWVNMATGVTTLNGYMKRVGGYLGTPIA